MKTVSVCRFMGVTAGFLHIDCASLYEWTIFIYLEISLRDAACAGVSQGGCNL